MAPKVLRLYRRHRKRFAFYTPDDRVLWRRNCSDSFRVLFCKGYLLLTFLRMAPIYRKAPVSNFEGIQALRFLAALMVVVLHSTFYAYC